MKVLFSLLFLSHLAHAFEFPKFSFASVDTNTPSVSNTALKCQNKKGFLVNSKLPMGTEDQSNPVKHIVIIMQENHSFDNYFGALNRSEYYGDKIDGANEKYFNKTSDGTEVHMQPEKLLCVADPQHGWDAVHTDWNNGKIDGFATTNEDQGNPEEVMGYFGPRDLPYYYELASQFAVGDRYFSSILTSTFSNRFYLYAGTSFGKVSNVKPKTSADFAQKTIFDELTENKITWAYYTDSVGYLSLFGPMYARNKDKMKKMKDYETDLKNNQLPQVVLLDAEFENGADEHPTNNIQIGQLWAAQQINLLLNSEAWKTSVLFLAYDENGGFFDHVAPPEACDPDGVAPQLKPNSQPGTFDRYGFRVPFVAVSPFVKHHYVSHTVYDHTSILKYIETKYNLPALTNRDANADGFSDIFDYAHPVYEVKSLPSAELDQTRKCEGVPQKP